MSSSLGKLLRESAAQDVGPVLQGDGFFGPARRAWVKALLNTTSVGADAASVGAPTASAALDAVGNAGEAFLDPTRRMPGQAVADKTIDFLTTPTALAFVTLPGAAFLYNATNYDRQQGFMRHAARAQNIGESPMTSNIRSFSKHAGLFSTGAGRVAGGSMEPISDLLKKLIMRQESSDISDIIASNPRRFLKGTIDEADAVAQDYLEGARNIYGQNVKFDPSSGTFTHTEDVIDPIRVGMLAGGALTVGAAADLLAPTTDVWGYQIQKKLTDSDDRNKLQDEALTGFVRSSSGGLGKVVSEMVGNALGSAGSAAGNAALTFTQSAVFSRVMANDPMLSQATGPDKDLLMRAYKSMTRFAPDVATDEFAVKNYLREALMSSTVLTIQLSATWLESINHSPETDNARPGYFAVESARRRYWDAQDCLLA